MSNIPSDAVVPINSDAFDVENPIQKQGTSKLVKQTSDVRYGVSEGDALRWWSNLGKCARAPSARSGGWLWWWCGGYPYVPGLCGVCSSPPG